MKSTTDAQKMKMGNKIQIEKSRRKTQEEVRYQTKGAHYSKLDENMFRSSNPEAPE